MALVLIETSSITLKFLLWMSIVGNNKFEIGGLICMYIVSKLAQRQTSQNGKMNSNTLSNLYKKPGFSHAMDDDYQQYN